MQRSIIWLRNERFWKISLNLQ